MLLVQTTVRLGFVPNLASAWLTSFAIGLVVAIPTAILVAPPARRLVGRLPSPPPDHRRSATLTAATIREQTTAG
jgi:hypothetical protein